MMIASLAAVIAGATGVGMLWWMFAARVGRTGDDRTASRRRTEQSGGAGPATPPEQIAEFAHPAQAWPSVDAENRLLDELLADKIDRAEYRTAMLRLARRCDSPTGDPS